MAQRRIGQEAFHFGAKAGRQTSLSSALEGGGTGQSRIQLWADGLALFVWERRTGRLLRRIDAPLGTLDCRIGLVMRQGGLLK